MKEREGHDESEFGTLYQDLRDKLMERIEGIDGDILISVVSQRPGHAPDTPRQYFSDWPDTYNRDTWYKTWAKGEFAGRVPPEASEQA